MQIMVPPPGSGKAGVNREEADMPDILPQLLTGAAILAAATLFGMRAVRKLVEVHEDRTEMRFGSPGRLRMIRGWSVAGAWLLGTWFLATIVGDWGRTGDLGGAVGRAQVRAYVVLEIVGAMAEADE